jgi:glycosyltransferase involved in cell wall biosynthesis
VTVLVTLPISVVIITRNSEKTLEECLNSVRANQPTEIIVVDGLSTDRTLEVALKFTDQILSDKGKGKSYARQLGAEQATQEYLSYVDSDIVLSQGCLSTMLAELQGSEHAGIGAGEPPGVKSHTYWEWAQRQHAHLAHPSGSPASIGMAASLFRRETILKYGFELGYGGYLDDVDLEMRMRKDRHTFGLSSATIFHHHREGFRSFVSCRFLFGRLCVYHMHKYGPWKAGFWPPMFASYWIGICLVKGKLKLIPYHVVDGVVETAGMTKGFADLTVQLLSRRLRASKRK